MPQSNTTTSNKDAIIYLKDTVYTANAENPVESRNRGIQVLNSDNSIRSNISSTLNSSGDVTTFILSRNKVSLNNVDSYIGVVTKSDGKEQVITSQGIAACLSTFGLPSSKYESLNLPAPPYTFTAPGNGFYILCKRGGAQGNWIELYNQTSHWRTCAAAASASGEAWVVCPAKKGEKVQLNYTASGATVTFQFHYTSGDANQSSGSGGDVPPAIIVDQAFNPTSTNAQSGTAVAQAIDFTQGDNISIQDHTLSSTNLFQRVVSMSSPSVPLNNFNSLYRYVVPSNTTISFNTSAVNFNNRYYTFELYLHMPTLYTITWPSNVTWELNDTPSINRPGKWFFVFRSLDNGSNWIGSCQGVW